MPILRHAVVSRVEYPERVFLFRLGHVGREGGERLVLEAGAEHRGQDLVRLLDCSGVVIDTSSTLEN